MNEIKGEQLEHQPVVIIQCLFHLLLEVAKITCLACLCALFVY
jgi:hypothetical protein